MQQKALSTQLGFSTANLRSPIATPCVWQPPFPQGTAGLAPSARSFSRRGLRTCLAISSSAQCHGPNGNSHFPYSYKVYILYYFTTWFQHIVQTPCFLLFSKVSNPFNFSHRVQHGKVLVGSKLMEAATNDVPGRQPAWLVKGVQNNDKGTKW